MRSAAQRRQDGCGESASLLQGQSDASGRVVNTPVCNVIRTRATILSERTAILVNRCQDGHQSCKTDDDPCQMLDDLDQIDGDLG